MHAGQFFEFQESTIGAAFLTQSVVINNGSVLSQIMLLLSFSSEYTVKFEIWDTAGRYSFFAFIFEFFELFLQNLAGQERYHSLAPMYYRGAAAAVVVYDVTNQQSFERAQAWVKELQRQSNTQVCIALAGNKSDKPNRAVTAEVSPTSLVISGSDLNWACFFPSVRWRKSMPRRTASCSWRRRPSRPST